MVTSLSISGSASSVIDMSIGVCGGSYNALASRPNSSSQVHGSFSEFCEVPALRAGLAKAA